MSYSTWLYCALVLIAVHWTNGQSTTCVYRTSEWTACVDGLQNRTMICQCDGSEVDLAKCQDLNLEEPELVQTCVERICSWKWTRWTRCSTTCDGGNTSRTQVCMCEGEEEPALETDCNAETHYGKEVAECNTFACDNIPAFNKIYWIIKADEGHWPMPDDTFKCSKGYDANSTSPFGKHYSTVLRDNNIQRHDHPEWYYLAKEWIAAQLNVANGVPFPEGVLNLITEVADLLEKCDGYSSKELYMVYSSKEKLGRVNNNIGGLDHVDDQVALLVGGNEGSSNDEANRTTFIMVIVIPGIAILVVLAIAGVTVYYVRRRSTEVVDNAAFDSEDEEEKGKGKNVVLEGEGGSEGKGLVQGERFDEEEQ